MFSEPLNSLPTPTCVNVNDETLQLIEHMKKGKKGNLPHIRKDEKISILFVLIVNLSEWLKGSIIYHPELKTGVVRISADLNQSPFPWPISLNQD